MFRIVRQLRQTISPRLKFCGLLLIAGMTCGALLELAGLGCVLPIIAALADPQLIHGNAWLQRLFDFLHPRSDRDFLLYLSAIAAVFYLLKAVFLILLTWAQTQFSGRLTISFADRMFRNYLHLPYSSFLTCNSADYINKITMLEYLTSGFLIPFFLIFAESLLLIFILVAILIFAPGIAVTVTAAGVLLGAGLYLPLRRFITRFGTEQFEENKNIVFELKNAMSSLKEIQLTGSADFFATRHLRAQTVKNNATMWMITMGNLPRFLLEAFAVVIALSVLSALLLRGMESSQIILYAAAFAVALFRILPSISRIQYNLIQLRRYAYLFNVIYQDLTALPKETAPAENTPITFSNSLSMEHVTFTYPGSPVPVIRNLSLTFHPLESIGVIGPTGCGKSTMIDLLMGFLTPEQGTVCSDGVDIRRNLPAWRRKIGYVSQNIYLSDDSIRRNIAFAVPDSEIDESRLNEVMRMAQISDFVTSLPQGASTIVGEGGARLSGGQKQRIAIARALYFRPELLILDEATSALDNDTEKAFIDAVTSLKGKITILMIAHRLSSLNGCDRTISLSTAGIRS